MIIAAILIGLGVGTMDPSSREKKPLKPNRRKDTSSYRDPFFGTPLEKF